MADIKISEMEELLPYDDYLATGGVQDEDVLTILDVSELEPSKLNKKVKVSTLLEKHSKINSPTFTGSPKTPTPSLTLETSTDIVNVNWVVEKLKQLVISDLADVQSNLDPQDGQTLVYDGLSNEWKAGSSTTTNNPSINNQLFNPIITSNFTLDDSYNNKMIPIDTTNGDIIITLGTNLQPGFQIIIYHYGGGKITIAPDGQIYRARGNTILNSNAAITLSFDLATNTWYGIGDLVQE